MTTEPPFPDLAAHLAYQHHFAAEEIHDLSEQECMDLHDDEHAAGYRGHKHEDTA